MVATGVETQNAVGSKNSLLSGSKYHGTRAETRPCNTGGKVAGLNGAGHREGFTLFTTASVELNELYILTGIQSAIEISSDTSDVLAIEVECASR